jgi:RHS repeat-associated protein
MPVVARCAVDHVGLPPPLWAIGDDALRWSPSVKAYRLAVQLVVGALYVLAGTTSAGAQATEYYATDAVGSIRVVFEPAGAVIARSDYLPFGEGAATTGALPSEQFVGRSDDAELASGYFNARFYDFNASRFDAPDTLMGQLFDPQSLNRYAYALNSPLVYTDTTGLCPARTVVGQNQNSSGAGVTVNSCAPTFRVETTLLMVSHESAGVPIQTGGTPPGIAPHDFGTRAGNTRSGGDGGISWSDIIPAIIETITFWRSK